MPVEKKRENDGRSEGTLTAEELLNSGLVGIWKKRTDIEDNQVFARKLRERTWTHRDVCNDHG